MRGSQLTYIEVNVPNFVTYLNWTSISHWHVDIELDTITMSHVQKEMDCVFTFC